MRNFFGVLFSFLSLSSVASAMPSVDSLLLSQVELAPDIEPKELPEGETIEDSPTTSEPDAPKTDMPVDGESESSERSNPPIDSGSGRGTPPESEPEDNKKTDLDRGKKIVKVTRQKRCQILIETEDVQLQLLPAGAILNLEKPPQTFSVRVNRTQSGKIFASLRKNDCGRQLQGQTFKYSLGDRFQSRRLESGGMNNENKDPTYNHAPKVSPISRPADDGLFLIGGIEHAKVQSISLSVYAVRLSYDWFSSPRAFRRNREGSLGGFGLALRGFKDFVDDSISSSFAGNLFLRYGYRWTTGDIAFGFAPTFHYNFLNSGTDKTEFLPSEYFHKIGVDVQFDYEFTSGFRAVLVGNYLLFPITKENLKELPTMIEALFGFQFLM